MLLLFQWCVHLCLRACLCVHVHLCASVSVCPCVSVCAFPWNRFPFKSLVHKFSIWESSACHCCVSPVTVEHSLQDCKTAESVHSSKSELPELLSNWPHDSWVTFPSTCESLFWLCSVPVKLTTWQLGCWWKCVPVKLTTWQLGAGESVCVFLSNWPHDSWVLVKVCVGSCQTDHMTAGLLSPALMKVCFYCVLFKFSSSAVTNPSH